MATPRYRWGGIRSYDLRDVNGVRWWRLQFSPFDFLIDPGIWIRDTRIAPPDDQRDVAEMRGIRLGRYVVRPLMPKLRFDHR